MRPLAYCLLFAFESAAQQRPPITGLAHVGFFVSDIDKAEAFYGHDLGFDRFSLDKPSGGLMLNYYKVNDDQYIEIYPGLKGDNQDRLSHVAFQTTDAKGLRDYLASKGVKVPDHLKPGLDGNFSFMVDDPEGRRIEFVQYVPGGLHASKTGLMPSTRVSSHMIHAGFIVHDRAREDSFYHDVLGFELMWYGGKTEDQVNWVDMRVPDGTDWIEYMLGAGDNPSPKSRGVLNHFALGIDNIHAVTVREGWEAPKIGRDGKWQLNLYDPDLTRVELMEFKSSQAPCCSVMHMK